MCPVSGASPFTSCPLSLSSCPRKQPQASCPDWLPASLLSPSWSACRGSMRWPRRAQDTDRCALSQCGSCRDQGRGGRCHFRQGWWRLLQTCPRRHEKRIFTQVRTRRPSCSEARLVGGEKQGGNKTSGFYVDLLQQKTNQEANAG